MLVLVAAIFIFVTIIVPSQIIRNYFNSSSPNSSQGIPLITPTNIETATFNLASTTTDINVSSQHGVNYTKNDLSIIVPPLGFSQNGIITLTEFNQQPPPVAVSPGSTPLPSAIGISKIYDLGPDGTQFEKPITVTIPYDKSMLNNGVDKNDIALAYYDGTGWVVVGGLVDTTKGTVTVSMTNFPGIWVEVVLSYLIYKVYKYDINQVSVYSNGDGLASGNAKTYVMPGNSVVTEYTKEAGIVIPPVPASSGQPAIPLKFIPLEDPDNPGHVNPVFITADLNGKKIGFSADPATMKGEPLYPTDLNIDSHGNDTNWTPPDKYFPNGLVGDCTCIANADLSMFRSLGIPAYGVQGYKDNTDIGQASNERHAWVELVLGGAVYYYDNDEGLKPLKDVESKLTRSGPLKGDGFMWNENGQQAYQKGWWNSIITSTSTTVESTSSGLIQEIIGPNNISNDNDGPYHFEVHVAGGTPPYNYTWEDTWGGGDIVRQGPQYPSVSLLLQEIPYDNGEWALAVTVTDSTGRTDTKIWQSMGN